MPEAANLSVPLTTASGSPTDPPNADKPYVLSYFAQRRAAGYIGIALPVFVWLFDRKTLGCTPASISASYYSGARSYMVGALCAVGVFLICSIGYKRDTKYSVFAGIMAFLVAFNPCTYPDPVDGLVCAVYKPLPYPYSGHVHDIAAGFLFLTFAFFCLVLFTRTTDDPNGFRPRLRGLPRRKKQRNFVFIVCGGVMLVTMAVMEGADLLKWDVPYLTLIGEWTCLWAFGIAWLVKGQQMLKDTAPEPGPVAVRKVPESEHASSSLRVS